MIVSTGVDGDGAPLGDAEGGVEGEADGDPVGDVDGDGGIDGVSSDGPGWMDGAVVGGTVGTWPSPPELVQAAETMSRPASAGTRRRWRGAIIADGLLMW